MDSESGERWADHSLVTESGQLVPGRVLWETTGSVNAGEAGHIWVSLAILSSFTWGSALWLGSAWEVGA